MNYCKYHFLAVIHTHNMSRQAYFNLKEALRGLFFEEQASRRSNKYWTSCKVSQFASSDPSSVDGVVLFEIDNANAVRRLKAIEGKMRELCNTEFKGLVTNIECQHKMAE